MRAAARAGVKPLPRPPHLGSELWSDQPCPSSQGSGKTPHLAVLTRRFPPTWNDFSSPPGHVQILPISESVGAGSVAPPEP